MVADRDKIVKFCNDYLKVNEIKDYGRNGIQVEGRKEVNKIVLGVSANLELFEKAAKERADMIIVHHGLFWKSDAFNKKTGNYDFSLTSYLKRRVELLIKNNISLLAYHLPLDVHPVIGNNAQFFIKAGLRYKGNFGVFENLTIGLYSETRIKLDELIKRVNEIFGANSMVFKYGPEIVRRVGFISGYGIDALPEAIELGMDTFITGSISEQYPSIAKEEKINLIAPGHYNSEKLGIIALGELIKKRFKVETKFVDIPNIV